MIRLQLQTNATAIAAMENSILDAFVYHTDEHRYLLSLPFETRHIQI